MSRDIFLGQHPMLQPQELRRGLIKPIENKFVADQLFTKTSVNALSVKYMQDADKDVNNVAVYDMAPEVGEGSRFERIGFSETEKMELIRKYGIEARITYEMQRFANVVTPIQKAFNKVQKAVLNTVDKMAYRVATNQWGAGTDPINQETPTTKWNNTTSGFDQFTADVIKAIATLQTANYNPNTIVMHPLTFAELYKNKDFQNKLETASNRLVPLTEVGKSLYRYIGLDVIVDPNFVATNGTTDNVLILERGTIGEIADAIPLTAQSYNVEEEMTSVVRAFRFTSAYLTDPKAIVLYQDVLA